MSGQRSGWQRVFKAGLLVALLLPVTVGTLFAQGRGKISGTVTDAVTGEPLPGVNVVIEGTSLGTATDVEGDYFIANLDAGTYNVRASFIGFNTVVVEDVRVSPNQTADVDIQMSEQVIEGEEVIVTAQRPLVERDNTTSITRLDVTEVQGLPTTDFTDVLSSLPSINVENGQILVRGGTLDEVAFLVDGARAGNPLDHSSHTRINLSAIQEVEVITGAFEAQYGEAMSGVINVIMKEGSDRYEMYIDGRYQPPGTKHWGTSFYDRSTDLFWENTHAMHKEWWIEHPDQWVDPNGIPGSDPRSEWTAEEAYQNYLETHQPLTDYTDIPMYQTEVGLGGPVPFIPNFYFFGSAKYRSEPPLFGNAFRDKGKLYDYFGKLTYRMGNGMKLHASSFYGIDETGWGFGDYPDFWWASNWGLEARYAYNDFEGFRQESTNGQTLRFSHALSSSTLYEIEMNRVQALRSRGVLPGDPIGWEATGPTLDLIRAVDENGDPIPAGYQNPIGYHYLGYYYRYDDDNTLWSLKSYLTSQVNKFWQARVGAQANYRVLDHFNEAKLPARFDDRVYTPFQGALYAQNKFEFGGFITNVGMRFDFYQPNDTVYTNVFDPLGGEKRKTSWYTQLSPRLGVSHPIDTRTVLHFSYGHFFQAPSFGDYGEGGGAGSLTTFIPEGSQIPWVLGNRTLRPRKTIAYEVGIERSFLDMFVLDVTAYYKDIRNTVRQVTVDTPFGTYTTNGNGDYRDVRGYELSLRKKRSTHSWGTFWGYASYTDQFGIEGTSGEANVIGPDYMQFPASGDFLQHYNPWFKTGISYQTPADWRGALGAVVGGLGAVFRYEAKFANDRIRQDYFTFEGEKHLRPPDQRADLEIRKEMSVKGVRFSPYVEISNLFNNRWIFLQVFERASREDQRRFVESDFEFIPETDANGVLILDVAKYRNLPRSLVFGLQMEF